MVPFFPLPVRSLRRFFCDIICENLVGLLKGNPTTLWRSSMTGIEWSYSLTDLSILNLQKFVNYSTDSCNCFCLQNSALLSCNSCIHLSLQIRNGNLSCDLSSLTDLTLLGSSSVCSDFYLLGQRGDFYAPYI